MNSLRDLDRARLYIFIGSISFMEWAYGISEPSTTIIPGASTSSYTSGQLFIIVSILYAFAFISTLPADWLGLRFGRKISLMVGDCLIIVGVAFRLPDQYGLHIVGRSFEGLGIGFNLINGIFYMKEHVPEEMRGKAGIFSMVVFPVILLLVFALGFSPLASPCGSSVVVYAVLFAFPILRILALLLLAT